jgi:hypothetical protein
MPTAFEFWRALDHLAAHIEQLPGTKDDRHREIVNAYSQAQAVGIPANVDQLQALAGELAAIERLIGGNGQWDV